MTLRTIRELRDATPFRPFEIHLSRGRALPVVTADHLFFFPKKPEILVALPDGGFQIINPHQIVSLGAKAAKARASKA